MRILKKSLPLLLAGMLPIVSYAEVHIINTTDEDGAAYSPYFEHCSSEMGNQGIIKKNDTMKIKQSYISTYCNKQPCDAEIHMKWDCSGKTIGVIQLDAKADGISTVTSFGIDGYLIRKIDNKTAIIERDATVRGVLGSVFK